MPRTGLTPSRQHQIAAYESWAQTPDRSARTSPARKAFEDKFLKEAGGDVKAAESARKAFYLRLVEKSVAARKARKQNGAA